MMKAPSSEMSGNTNPTTQNHIPEGFTISNVFSKPCCLHVQCTGASYAENGDSVLSETLIYTNQSTWNHTPHEHNLQTLASMRRAAIVEANSTSLWLHIFC